MKTLKTTTILAIISSFIILTTNTMAMAGSSYCKTKYPILLVHGVLGFDSIAGMVDHWYGIPKKLKDGGAIVRQAKMSALNNNDVRTDQLIKEIEDFLSDTGASKVNLIAHSHGSTTSRQAAYIRPELVASLTTIAGPHKGAPVADFASEQIPPSIQGIAFDAGDLVGEILDLLSGNDGLSQSTEGMMIHFTQEGIQEFNEKYPCKGVPTKNSRNARGDEKETFYVNGQPHTIKYYSWTGNAQKTNILDPDNNLWPVLHFVNMFYGTYEDDGLIGVNSSHLGMVLCDTYKWNHLDEINQNLGIRKPFSADPRNVIREHANRLKMAGL
ncbi:lactonizing lipase [Candidatus Magnetomorum sp. HK-1]|nr:lactonizing lipase [Candidatus Magnetomorum sp. HK-1]